MNLERGLGLDTNSEVIHTWTKNALSIEVVALGVSIGAT
jgi:hypothetical protein